MRAVKGYVVLAIMLLIPSVGYFHKQHFFNELKPRLELIIYGPELVLNVHRLHSSE